MTDFNLIDYVVPTGGYYCVVGAGSGFHSEFTDDRAQVDVLAEKFVKQGKDAPFWKSFDAILFLGEEIEDLCVLFNCHQLLGLEPAG